MVGGGVRRMMAIMAVHVPPVSPVGRSRPVMLSWMIFRVFSSVVVVRGVCLCLIVYLIQSVGLLFAYVSEMTVVVVRFILSVVSQVYP